MSHKKVKYLSLSLFLILLANCSQTKRTENGSYSFDELMQRLAESELSRASRHTNFLEECANAYTSRDWIELEAAIQSEIEDLRRTTPSNPRFANKRAKEDLDSRLDRMLSKLEIGRNHTETDGESSDPPARSIVPPKRK